MLRILLAASATLFLAAPAVAQVSGQLSSAPWTCKMISLAGDPPADVSLNFESGSTLYASFYLEIPQDGDIVGMAFDATGRWNLTESVISIEIDTAEVTAAWYNDEPLGDAAKAEMNTSLGADLSSFSGESSIVYIADHAMVLEEPDTSISCWR